MNERELQDLYRRSTATRDRAQCLDSDTMMRLSEGELDPATTRSAADHLAGCSDCAAEYSLLDPLRRWADGATAPFETNERVRELRPASRAAWPSALAAAAILAVVGLSATSFLQWRRAGDLADQLSGSLRQEAALRSERDAARHHASELSRSVDELSRPQINVPIIDLDAVGPLRGGATPAAKAIEVPPGATRFDIVLYVSDSTNYERYDIEIRGADEVVIWRAEGLRRSGFDTFTIGLPARMFPAGKYHLMLIGHTGNESRTVQRYDIQILYR